MANSISRLDLLTGSTAGRDTLANELFNPMSPAALFGRRSQGCTGLTWAFYGGAMILAGTPTAIPNGTVTLTNSATNYVQANPATGAVTAVTGAWTSGLAPLYRVVVSGGVATSWIDYRSMTLATVP